MHYRVAVIGAGFVGSTVAQRIAEKQLADVILIDIADGVPQGKALDMAQSGPIEGFGGMIVGGNDFSLIKGAHLVVMTAGFARKPGMSREDLVQANAKIIIDVSGQIKRYAPDAMVIMVTNPLDIMTAVSRKILGCSHTRVFGMAGVLDTARYRAFLSMELGVNAQDIQAMVLGGHGDDMVPLVEYTTVSGIPIKKLLDSAAIERIIQRTRKGGGEIVSLLKTGSAYYAPSAAAVQMVEAVIRDQKRLLPVSAYLTGQYGITDTYIGVPAVIGQNGVEKIIELDLCERDRDQLMQSARAIQESVAAIHCV